MGIFKNAIVSYTENPKLATTFIELFKKINETENQYIDKKIFLGESKIKEEDIKNYKLKYSSGDKGLSLVKEIEIFHITEKSIFLSPEIKGHLDTVNELITAYTKNEN